MAENKNSQPEGEFTTNKLDPLEETPQERAVKFKGDVREIYEKLRAKFGEEQLLAYLDAVTRIKGTVVTKWLYTDFIPFSNMGTKILTALQDLEKDPEAMSIVASKDQVTIAKKDSDKPVRPPLKITAAPTVAKPQENMDEIMERLRKAGKIS